MAWVVVREGGAAASCWYAMMRLAFLVRVLSFLPKVASACSQIMVIVVVHLVSLSRDHTAMFLAGGGGVRVDLVRIDSGHFFCVTVFHSAVAFCTHLA